MLHGERVEVVAGRSGKDDDGAGFGGAHAVYGGLVVEMVVGEGYVDVGLGDFGGI